MGFPGTAAGLFISKNCHTENSEIPVYEDIRISI
jgi:hypothetical protein